MGRKRVLRIAKTAKIKCPKCSAISVRKVPEDSSPGYFDCDKCNSRINTPITQCCVICAYTNKKCVPALKMEAYRNKLEMK